MSGTISFNPYATTTPQNTFLLQSQGYIQGFSYDDPSAYQWLAGGLLASTETLPMWGGVPIEELVNLPGTGSDGLGGNIKRAASQVTVTGWCVFNQAASMVITPGNSVPLASVNNYVAFYRLQTQQRVAVQADPALAAAISGDSVAAAGAALYWDVTNYRVTTTSSGGNFALPASTRLLSINSNSKVVSYNSGTGAVTWTAGSAAIILI